MDLAITSNMLLKEKDKPKKERKKTKTQLRKIADKVFSEYIRRRDNGKCYTCKKQDDWKRMQCGHFIPRQYLSVRYDEVNCHCQCYACNMLYNGQPGAYATRLDRDYGRGTVEMLEKARQEVVPNFDYQYVIDVYKEKLEHVQF